MSNQTKLTSALPGSQTGFNLIELMITLVISLVVLSGASVVLVNANKSNRVQNDLVKMQSNARFAMQQIASDIQRAGHYGCVEDSNPVDPAGPIISQLNTNVFLNTPVQGYEHSSTPVSALTAANKDVLELQFAFPVTELAADMGSPIAPIVVTDSSTISVPDILLIANCEAGDIFVVSDVDRTTNTIKHETDTTSGIDLVIENNSDSLSAWYPRTSYIRDATEIYRFGRIKYFIQDLNGSPTLYRTINKGINGFDNATEVFVRGVDAFEVLYGEDTNNDSRPDVFVNANVVANWGNISAIKFALLVRSENEYGDRIDSGTTNGETINVLGINFVADDARVRRRIYQSTVYLRNSI